MVGGAWIGVRGLADWMVRRNPHHPNPPASPPAPSHYKNRRRFRSSCRSNRTDLGSQARRRWTSGRICEPVLGYQSVKRGTKFGKMRVIFSKVVRSCTMQDDINRVRRTFDSQSLCSVCQWCGGELFQAPPTPFRTPPPYYIRIMI